MKEDKEQFTASVLIAKLALFLKEQGDLPVVVTEWGGAHRIPVTTVTTDNGLLGASERQIYIG